MALSVRKTSRVTLLIPVVLILLFLSLIPQTQRRAPWYEQMLANLLAPASRLFTAIGGGVTSVWDDYIALVGTHRDNEFLRAENARMQGELIRMNELKDENERLRQLLEYREQFSEGSVVARVIANDPRAEFKSLMIDRGSDDGIELFMPVVGPKGLVGRIGRVAGGSAQVLLLNDPNCAVDAMVQRSRARGLLVGEVSHTSLRSGYYLTRMEYMQRTSDIHDNDVVVSSGLDQVFPPGLPVGTVHNVSTSRYGIFKEAEVVPFENVQELQEVMVLLYRPAA